MARTFDKAEIGADGLAMLALSTAIIMLSLGTSLLAAFGLVLLTAWLTPTTAPRSGRVLVLGKRLQPDGTISGEYRERLARAAKLWRAMPTRDIVILGGLTTPGAETEAAAGAAWLRDQGISAERIHLEDRSRHTLESLRFYRVQFGATQEPPILITSRYHLARSGMLADGLGIASTPCAAEPRFHVADLPRCLSEALLIHWYLTGRGFARLTCNRQMTARIR